MRYLPSARTLSNPLSSWRQDEILSPLLEDDGFKDKRLHALYEEVSAERWEKSKTVTARTLIPLVEYHKLLSDKIHQLRGKEVIYMNPVSLDMSEERPRKVIVDQFSDLNRGAYQRMEMFEELDVDPYYFVFIPVGPVIVPDHATDERIVHAIPDTVKTENSRCREMGWRVLGPSERSREPEFKSGFYKFSESFYDSRLAKAWFPKEEEAKLELHCRYNRLCLAQALSTVVEIVNSDEIVYFGKMGSFAFKVLEKVSERTGKPLKNLRVMRNVNSNLGECDDSAVRILQGYVNQRWNVRQRREEAHAQTGSVPTL